MAIQFIDNQPITFKTNWETDSECKTSLDRACTLYSRDDFMFAQFKQTQCASATNLICDPPFLNANAEQVVNGDFTVDDLPWTYTGVTYDSINKRMQFDQSGTTNGDLEQSITTRVIGDWYTLTFTLGGATRGNIFLYIGGVDLNFMPYYNGTFSLTFQWGGTVDDLLVFYADNFFDGYIDNISLKGSVLQDCWVIPQGEWNIIDDYSITKVVNTPSAIDAKISAVPLTGYAKLNFTVSGMTQGTLYVQDTGGNTLMTVTANGSYEHYYTMLSEQVVTFSGDADWNGTLSDFILIEFSNNFTFHLTDGSTIYDLSPEAEYFQDWVTLKADMSGVPSGCYNLVVYDACGHNINTEIITDTNLTNGGVWDFISYSYCDVEFTGSSMLRMKYSVAQHGTQSEVIFIDTPLNQYFDVTTNGITYVINYEFTTGIISQPCYIDFYDAYSLTAPNGFGCLHLYVDQSNTTYTGQFLYQAHNQSWPFPNSNPTFKLYTVSGTGLTVGQVAELTHISLKVQSYVPDQATAYYSNCIEIREDTDCTKWVAGTNGEDSYGFHFDPTNIIPFQLGARVRSMLINPKYRGDLKRYNDAGGKYTVTRGASDKSYTLFIDYTDEHTHDWLRLATHCDTINIGYSYDSNEQYVATDGDYEPEWPSQLGDWPSAQARIEVQKKQSTLFNNNAG